MGKELKVTTNQAFSREICAISCDGDPLGRTMKKERRDDGKRQIDANGVGVARRYSLDSKVLGCQAFALRGAQPKYHTKFKRAPSEL